MLKNTLWWRFIFLLHFYTFYQQNNAHIFRNPCQLMETKIDWQVLGNRNPSEIQQKSICSWLLERGLRIHSNPLGKVFGKVLVGEGCLCWKLFSKEAKASKQGPRNPSTAPQRIPLHLENHKRLDHGFCLHMGDGPHHHCCGEWKICGGESTVNNPGCPCHHIPTFQVGLVTMLVVLIPAACMICYHSYVRFQQQIPVLLNNMFRNFNMNSIKENF